MKPCVTHHHACDCRERRFAATETALRSLLLAQGEIHPVWNDEYLKVTWVREIALRALEVGGSADS